MFIRKDRSDDGSLQGGGSISAGARRTWLGLGQWQVERDECKDRLGRKKELCLTTLLETDIEGLIKNGSKCSILDKNGDSGGRHGNFRGR